MMDHKKRDNRKSLVMICTILSLIMGFTLYAWMEIITESDALASPAKAAPGSFSSLIKEARSSVVNISTVKIIKGSGRVLRFRSPFGPNDPFHDFFDRFFKDQIPKDFRQKSLGSGFIIDKEGYILTNNHVVEKTDEIKVKLADEKEYEARIIGRDPKTDLALIRIEIDESLKSLPLGDSDKLEVGDWVVAIGNPFGLGHTVTAGIVSAKYRKIGAGSYENFIQTDASINPGNSGGPLLDINGKVVGINSAILSRTGGSVGIGFAIPINMVRDLLPQLKKGKVIRGWLGVMIQKVTSDLKDKLKLKDERGALVADVTPDGPAEKAGIKRGDVIISFDGNEIREMNDLPFIVASTPVDKTVPVEVIRKGKKETFNVKIGEMREEKEPGESTEEKSDLGMRVEEITPELARHFGITQKRGLVVVKVEKNSPAGEAGIRQGDLIIEIDQEPMKELEGYGKKIQQFKKGDTVLFLIKRGGNTLYVTLKIWE
ncbi:MAG: DegQ family serine endoprotease [Thermodesulfobacteriota bacterium]|nr:DegQ family serine endoprotease [Thermodesulfobacteriota bacterium]